MTLDQSAYWPLVSEKKLQILYEKYSKILFSRAYFVVKEESLAEEIVQDVFISVWFKREYLVDHVDNIEAYLFGILKKKVYDSFRKIVKNRLIALVDSETTIDHVNEWYDEKELRILLDQLVAKLPEKQQEVFKLIKIEGFKREEVAHKLGISPNTVKNHLATATKFLKDNMDAMLVAYVASCLS